jgi:hypothetical protein
MQRSSFLRALSLCLVVIVGCGADDPSMVFPEDDAAVDADGTVVEMDAGALPSFDVPVADVGNPTPDRGTPTVDTGTDRGNTVVDTGSTSTDRGTVMACPSSCGSDLDCNPCRTSSDPSSVRYCCLSGLCISMTGACPSEMMGGGGGGSDGGGAGGDGGGGGGADGGLGTDSGGGGGTDSGGGPG